LNLHDDLVSRSSMREFCIFDLVVKSMPRQGHELADPIALDRALDALEKPQSPEPDQLAQCNARIEAQLNQRFDQVRKTSDKAAARALLKDLDDEYGGLAAPEIFELDQKLSE
jgi:hypothetical protein